MVILILLSHVILQNEQNCFTFFEEFCKGSKFFGVFYTCMFKEVFYTCMFKEVYDLLCDFTGVGRKFLNKKSILLDK